MWRDACLREIFENVISQKWRDGLMGDMVCMYNGKGRARKGKERKGRSVSDKSRYGRREMFPLSIHFMHAVTSVLIGDQSVYLHWSVFFVCFLIFARWQGFGASGSLREEVMR